MAARTSRNQRQEERQQAADLAAQEVGPGLSGGPLRIARDYIHAVHPQTGVNVVFVPDEALPAWVEVPKEGNLS